jgi:hypothetical protein
MKKRVNAHAQYAMRLKAEHEESLLIILVVQTKQAGAKTANQQRKIVIVVETAGHQRKIAETKKNIT